jgi:hypothetical protein
VHVQQKDLARRQERKARNASRALRKALGDANVNEDEGDEEESEADDSVNRKNYQSNRP